MNWFRGLRPLGRRLCLLAVVLGALALSLAGSASATTTIGQTTTTANYLCAAESDLQAGVAFGPSFVVPAGKWLLTSWGTFAGSGGGQMSLMIFRPTALFSTYTVVAESPVQALAPSVLNTFPASVVVQGGDFLGFWSGGGAACATFTASPADVNPFLFGAEPGVGSTVTMPVALGFLLNISATISGPADVLATLLADVTGIGPGTSLADKVKLTQDYVSANNKPAACTTLNGFISEVKAQDGKMLSGAQAASFTAQANNTETLLGC
jgi:hypothetical protein